MHGEAELHHAQHDRHRDQRPERARRARRKPAAEAEREQMHRIAQQRGIGAPPAGGFALMELIDAK